MNIYIPAVKQSDVMKGPNSIVNSERIRFDRMEAGRAVFEVESGSYKFKVPYDS